MSAPIAIRYPIPSTVIGIVHVLCPDGELHSADFEALKASLADLAEAETPVVVDLSSVPLIDPAAARGLRKVIAAFVRHGVRLRIAGAAGQPLAVLEVLGLAKELGAHQAVAKAIADLQGRAEPVIDSMGVLVHHLLAEASAVDADDARRQGLEAQAIELALPLARTLARRFRHLSEPMDDLVQVASLGMVNAVRRYDPSRSSGFVAFAVPTVLGELRRHLRDHGWTVRPPRRLQEIRTEMIAATSDLTQKVGREPTVVDLARCLRTPVVDIEAALATTSGLRPASLDAPLGGSTDQSLYAVIGAPDEDIDLVDFRVSVRPLIADLPEQVQKILVMRFDGELTQSQIAEHLGMSQMNISRILRSTLAKLRRTLLGDGEQVCPS